jgi:hypothetical protein
MYEPNYEIISRELKYVYDDQNRLVLEEGGVNDYKYVKYIYDNSSREIKSEYYNVNWELIRYVDKVYEGTSKLVIEELYYDKDGVQTLKYQHLYDKWGNLTETILGDCSLFKRKYNGELLIEEIHYDLVWDCTERGMSKHEYEKQ